MWSTLIQTLSSSPGISWDALEDFRFTSVTDLQENDYLNCCKLIFIKLDQPSTLVEGHRALLEDIILKKKINLLPIICNQLISCDESHRRDELCHLLNQFIFRKKHLVQTFLQIVEKGTSSAGFSKLVDDDMIRCIINVPSYVANKMQLKTPQSFIPVNYFAKLCSIIFVVFCKIHKRIQKEKDCRVDFFCNLIGKIASSGYSDIVWKQFTSLVLNNCANDFIWRRIGHKLIISQSDRNVEGIIRHILMFASDPNQAQWILKDAPLQSAKINYLFTEKFILGNHYENKSFIINLIGYLANISTDLFIKTLDNLLSAWSNGSAVKHRSFEQQFYICCGLAISAKYLRPKDLPKQTMNKFLNCVIHATEIYLLSVLPEIRFTGLYVSKLFLSILKSEGPQFEVNIEKLPEVITLMELYGTEPHTIDTDKTMKNEDIDISMSKLSTKSITDDEEEDEEDDEDDLTPYDLSNDIPVDKTKKPIYVVDCISGLRDVENCDWNQICLKSTMEIIDKNASMIEDYAEDFAISLLNLQDTFETPDFVTLRRDALVKLLTVSPITVATYLTGQFYDNNLDIERRLLILETLAMASQKICKFSCEEDSKMNDDTQLITKVIPNDIVIAEAKWKTVVEDRIMSKTKIISKPRTKNTYVNKFIQFSGHFFFPLMKHHDSPNITFNLVGEDYYLLGRLLYTLGIILESSSQAPITRRMGKSLIEFLWAFRYHVESFVRQAIIFCLCMIFISVPRTYLLEYMQNDLIEFKKWLIDVTEKDSDKDCIERSLNALFLLKQLVDSEA
uniref:Telomere length regulation protein conserved domain-containing protein n=2 Tax=Tetranychus urticae TaxID=32264 RepID=T1JZE4_TETUR